MDLSIAIVSWNTRDLLDQCLKSVYETTTDLDFEVFIVDNASSDGSQEMVTVKYPQAILIANDGNVGFARANNQAFSESVGRYFLLLNPDTIVTPNAFANLVKIMGQHTSYGACGPMLINGDGSLQPSWASLPSIWHEIRGIQDRRIDGIDYSNYDPDIINKLEPMIVGWVGGACLLLRRQVIDEVGVMDESFAMYCEETDWCWRIQRKGYKVAYVPSVSIVHLGGQSSKQAPLRCQKWLQMSKTRLAYKRFGLMGSIPVGIAGVLRIIKTALFVN